MSFFNGLLTSFVTTDSDFRIKRNIFCSYRFWHFLKFASYTDHEKLNINVLVPIYIQNMGHIRKLTNKCFFSFKESQAKQVSPSIVRLLKWPRVGPCPMPRHADYLLFSLTQFFPNVLGEITLVDYDTVELSNLHRQILHNESSVGLPKVTSAYNALTRYVIKLLCRFILEYF